MAKRIKFNLCDVTKGHVQKKEEGAQPGEGRVCKQERWQEEGVTPVQEKAWLAFSSVSRA